MVTQAIAGTGTTAKGQTTSKSALSRIRLAESTVLTGRLLFMARVAWASVVMFAVGMFVIAIPARYEQLLSLTNLFDIIWRKQSSMGWAPDAVRASLDHAGLSATFYANTISILEISCAFIFLLVAGVIFWRKSNDWLAIALSSTLVGLGVTIPNTIRTLVEIQPGWQLPFSIVTFIGWSGLGVILFALFPNGRFAAPWVRVWCVGWEIHMITWVLPHDSPLYAPNWPACFTIGGLVLAWGTGGLVQLYRYWRVSNHEQRQQTKWVVYGISLAINIIALVITLSLVFPELSTPDQAGVLYDLIGKTVVYPFVSLIPLSIGIAILRSKLWDIDIIIGRTLVYVPLTAILAGLYSASVAFFQKVFVTVTGEQSDAAVVIITLIIVAAVTPIKNALQTLVDKRFKEDPNTMKRLNGFGDQVQQFTQMLNPQLIAGRLLEEAVGAVGAQGGALYLLRNNHMELASVVGEWREENAQLALPIKSSGMLFGRLMLGPHRDGTDYTAAEREVLQSNANRVASAISTLRAL